jgi:hypothetical protein
MEAPKRWLGCQALTLSAPRMIYVGNNFGRCAPLVRRRSSCPAAAATPPPHGWATSVVRCERCHFPTILRNHRPHARQTVSVHCSFSYHGAVMWRRT